MNRPNAPARSPSATLRGGSRLSPHARAECLGRAIIRALAVFPALAFWQVRSSLRHVKMCLNSTHNRTRNRQAKSPSRARTRASDRTRQRSITPCPVTFKRSLPGGSGTRCYHVVNQTSRYSVPIVPGPRVLWSRPEIWTMPPSVYAKSSASKPLAEPTPPSWSNTLPRKTQNETPSCSRSWRPSRRPPPFSAHPRPLVRKPCFGIRGSPAGDAPQKAHAGKVCVSAQGPTARCDALGD